ncbi:MAG: HlyD family type I secretion periplasmic adaptor subunit [Proteobacteria bacterium]|nr:HlyD family type I secretion periplasmic adaptor subunit [Pseudomonadota bacterium]
MAETTSNPSALGAMNPSGQPVGDDMLDSALGIAGPARLGFAVILLFFVGFGAWAALAPLESAAIAMGSVSVESQRKTVQHLEGGIIREILVRDGDRVEQGQVMLRLDETQTDATVDLLRKRFDVAQALFARLSAQRDASARIAFPDQLTARYTDPDVRDIITSQDNIFQARRQSLDGQVGILNQRAAQLLEEILGLEGEIAAQDRQIELLKEEIADLKQLWERRLIPKARLLERQSRLAEIEGRRSQSVAGIARARQSIGESRMRMTELTTTMVNEAVDQLGRVQGELLDLGERLNAAQDVRKRTEIVAPQAGTVVGLRVHTTGGVISPGQELLDIVPSGDRLIIEAQIDPQDIDIVHKGLNAHVRLTSFSQRSAVPIAGRVISVSADRLTDERSGFSYYLAKVALTEDPYEILDGAVLYPGMPDEVMIVTGSRTALDYLLRPITSSLRRSMRES